MNEHTDDGARDEALFRLHEDVLRLHEAGAAIDAGELAARHGVTADDVARCVAAVAALAGPPLHTEPPPALPDDFELLGEVGRGGMGIVYKARQRSLNRMVAIKVLRPGDAGASEPVQRFRREAQSLARLRHPHIVAIHDVGAVGGQLYFTMAFVDGESLARLVRTGEMTPTRVVRLLRQVAGAIAHSHGVGVLHRDLKPGNVLVDARDDAFVVDFGLARDLAGRGEQTVSGQLLGTPAYMSPEQARGDTARIGERSDVYALGAILYECLAGRPPFAGQSLVEQMHAVLHDDPRPLRKLRPDVPGDLERICAKAMAKDPDRRYATATALLEDLDRFHDGRPVLARPASLTYRCERFGRRHWRALLLGGVAAATAVALFATLVLPGVRPPASATMASAVALAERGEQRAAKLLLERAMTENGEPAIHAELLQRSVAVDVALMAEALAATPPNLATARQLLESAAEHAIAAIEGEPRGKVLEAARLLAAKADSAGAHDVAAAAIEVVGRLLQAQQFAVPTPDVGGLIGLALGQGPGSAALLAQIGSALRDPADGLRDVVARLVVDRLAGDYTPTAGVVAWLDGEVERDPETLAPLMRAFEGIDDRRRERLFRLFAGRGDEQALARRVRSRACLEVLARFATDSALDPLARTIAADLLALHADLPLRAPRAGANAEVPIASVDLAPRIVALWREVADLDRVASFAHRIAAAMATPELAHESTRCWLDDHTLGPPGTARGGGSVAAWREWWAREVDVDPRDRLARGLGLTPEQSRNLPLLLDRLVMGTGRESVGLHHLLSLQAEEPAAGELPRWVEGEEMPDSLLTDWWSVVHRGEPGPMFTVHLLMLGWSDGDGEPTSHDESVFTVRLGERLGEVASRQDLAAMPIAFGDPQVPGFNVPQAPAATTETVAWPALQVRLARGGGFVLAAADPQRETVGVTTRRTNVSGHSSAWVPVREGRVAAQLLASMPPWANGCSGVRMGFATFAAGRDTSTLGISGWCGRVAAFLRELPKDFWRDPVGGGCNFAAVDGAARAIEFASLVPVPEALEDLRRLVVTIPQHVPAGSDSFSRHAVRARLLLGDAEPLRDAERFAVQVPVVDDEAIGEEPERSYWLHVLARSRDVDLRREAARRVALLPVHGRREWYEPLSLGVPAGVVGVGLIAALLATIAAAVRRRWPGAGAARGCVLAGAMVATFDVAVHGVPILPAAVGYALMAVGLRALQVPRAAVFLLLAAAVAATVEQLGEHAFAGVVATTAAALALLTLPFARQPASRAVRRRLTLALGVLGFGLFAWAALPALFAEWRARLVYGLPAWIHFGDAAWQWDRQLVPLCGAALLLVGAVLAPARRTVSA